MSYALITGASKGIGRAIATELASRKINLLLIARTEETLKTLAKELSDTYSIQTAYFVADLSKEEAAQQVFNWCTTNQYAVQYLVNNAGYGLSGPFENYSLQEHLDNMQVNMNAVVKLTYLFLPLLKQSTRSYILNISSSAAYQAVPYLGIYSATKAFVLRFSRALHHELHKTNVSLTCVSPGSTETDFATRANVGHTGMKLAKKVNMQADAVAKIAVNAMFQGKAEVVTGLINKLGVFLAWILPNRFVEKTSAKIYQ